MSQPPIRVLLVDDSAMFRVSTWRLLEEVKDIEVVGTANNGRKALEAIDELKPDLVTLDLEMPEMDGLEVLRQLRRRNSPVAVIMLSAHTSDTSNATKAALELGAFDFVLKPKATDPYEAEKQFRESLVPRIQAFVRRKTVRELLWKDQPSSPQGSGAMASKDGSAVTTTDDGGDFPIDVVAIGASTGGPEALATVLADLPSDLEAAVLIVQHMPSMFTASLANDLNHVCPLQVVEATDGQPVVPGKVFVAPGGRQMKVVPGGDQIVVEINDDPPERDCRPSVDYLFRSVALLHGPRALGVVLTGMGEDGTLGSQLMKRYRAKIIAQDEATCVVYGMSRRLVEEGIADIVAPLDAIPRHIASLCKRSITV